MQNKQWGVYGYVDNDSKGGTIVYIGIDRNFEIDDRDKTHKKPSKLLRLNIEGKTIVEAEDVLKWVKKYKGKLPKEVKEQDGQVINNFIQQQPNRFEYIRLAALEVDSQPLAYAIETSLINLFKPCYNIKGAEIKL